MSRFFVLIFLVLACVRPAAADAVFAENGVAVRGTDVVAYFTVGDAVPGKPEFRHDWNGAAWHFASAQNRDAFAADPQRYAPQYGGFCAWAVANNYTAPIDPEAWRIVDGKLYLNYSRAIRLRWDMMRQSNIAKADANWPELSRR